MRVEFTFCLVERLDKEEKKEIMNDFFEEIMEAGGHVRYSLDGNEVNGVVEEVSRKDHRMVMDILDFYTDEHPSTVKGVILN